MALADKTSPIPFWTLLVLAVLLWGGEYVRRDLWAPDEVRYAYVAQEMQDTDQYAIPHRHGEYYAHKPPLMFWLISLGSKITGGINALSTRLPSLFGALLSLWATSRLALRWGGPAASWRAPLILMTSLLFWWKGGWGQIDSLLCGFEMLALLALFTLPISGASAPRGAVSGRFAIAGIAMGLAILAKGPVGLLVPVLAFIVGSLAAGEGRQLKHWHWLWAIPLALAIPGLWLLWVQGSNPPDGYLAELLYDQNVSRAAGAYDHQNPFYFFLLSYPGEMLPWSLFLPAAILTAKRVGGETWQTARRLIGWALIILLFFSLSPSKRDLYVLLAYPAAAILIGISWDRIVASARRWESWGSAAIPLIIGLASLGAVIAGLAKPDLIPINTLWFIPNAIVGIGAAVWLLRRSGRTGQLDQRWFSGLVAGLFLSFALLGAVALPALNPVKAPTFLAQVADDHIPADGHILLHKVMGENIAFFAKRPGRYSPGPQRLARQMNAEGTGVIVLKAEYWPKVPPELQARITSKNPFQVGSKDLLWCPFNEG